MLESKPPPHLGFISGVGAVWDPGVGGSALICLCSSATSHLIYGLIDLQLLTRDQNLHTNLVLGELNALVGVCVSGVLKTTYPTK